MGLRLGKFPPAAISASIISVTSKALTVMRLSLKKPLDVPLNAGISQYNMF